MTAVELAGFQEHLPLWRARLDTRFAEVDPVFESCMVDAVAALSPEGLDAYLDQARTLGKLGRGVEPMLIFLAEWPQVARSLGEDALPTIAATVHALYKSPNGKAIVPFLQSLPAVARRLPALPAFQRYLSLSLDFMDRTTGSIHGHHKTFASPGLPLFFEQAPRLLDLLSVGGLGRWVEYGIRNHLHHPEHQREYFGLRSADARAVLQRERRGTLLADQTRELELTLRALWRQEATLVPYATVSYAGVAANAGMPLSARPYVDDQGMRLPDVYEDRAGVRGIDRYRAALAHMAGHRRWSRPQVADNWSPAQRLAVETFEDARIDTLVLREYPGLRDTLLRLHPTPVEGACDPATQSCLRHRLAMLSRALLDSAHGYGDPDLLAFCRRFHETLADGPSSTEAMAQLALSCVARIRRQSDQLPDVFFTDTEVDYRDDNRHLWIYIEAGDEEESFDDPQQRGTPPDVNSLPPRHYPEWDHQSQSFRPDWVSLYERLQPCGDAADIHRILARHAALAKQLQRLLDLLKPQDRQRIRFQEDGSELDLDVAIRSLTDFRGGAAPDPRVHMSHRTDGRDIAVLLLLDLSHSLNAPVDGAEQTVLELSREAVTLLAWAIEQLGDPFAIAGFHSNTRHDVRYHHIKGFEEGFDDAVKGRLAGIEAAYSTRMGAALRHAGHYLGARKSDKKLLLILTDGEPSDVDTPDERALIEDAREAVRELGQEGIYTHCISLDPMADAYVGDIFGGRHTVIENVQRLPERLPQLFMGLTR
ncbi:nitric oxide reductase activation protein NorD [Hydrogenophaga sp. RWCD_12]|uniref:nitric oxide reductase activation protein NorD n=1 Tax=Hydrogenophaga sp. RWCD_12 TaxID=3391190 RepID=UPI003984E1BB